MTIMFSNLSQKKIPLIIGLVLSIALSIAINTALGVKFKDDEFHTALVVVASHNPSNYTVTLTKDVTDALDNDYPAGTPLHVVSLFYNLPEDKAEFSLVYIPEGETSLTPNFVTNFSLEDINPSADLDSAIATAKDEAVKRDKDLQARKTTHKVTRIIISVVAFIAVNLITLLLAGIDNPMKRRTLLFAFFAVCLMVTVCAFMAAPYLGHK